MKLKASALLAALLLAVCMSVQPVMAAPVVGTTGGADFGRWVEIDTMDTLNITLNMSIPELITNETTTTFYGNALNNDVIDVTIYVGIGINGTWRYSGAVSVAGNNSTTENRDVAVTFGPDILAQGDGQWINVTLKVDTNTTLDGYWNGTINVTTQFGLLTDWTIYTMTSIITVMLVMVAVSMIVHAIGRTKIT